MRGGLVLLTLAAASTTASAGRTYYGWLYGTEVMPERGAELMTWISEENRNSDEHNLSETRWWVGPLIGVTDQVELALPLEISWTRSDIQNGRTAFDRYGAEVRYRFVSQDPVDAPPLAPLVRVAIKREVLARSTISPEADIVVSFQRDIVHVLSDVGFYGEISGDTHHFEIRPGVGVSIEVADELRLGAEVFAHFSLDDRASSWAVVGPNIAYSHGRTWISAVYGIGVYGIKDAPKVQWGIAF